ncbi:MAG: response regulator [Alphaproteobacteria bacterium]|jgi:two-component system chemotaxis response regulator CheY|uniref:response regulator n=1 Tax=Devosia sp. XGJD_8 TaxID=3391187 RepID=UPI001DF8116B|nr:response regulator [Alphaproteobacteria bacterium]MBU1560406.1 response regulator [Alphaproteobacteria bacterium]MBU2303731.1 response regulator [Alphaproteobacteria bacterium]MBU2366330.1 response regulator [Alphaproteobacteria bacterium]
MANEEITKHGVLVADHSPHMAALISVMLRSLGRRDIREAYDASKAMIELRRRIFDVLIIDDDLQGMDGVVFTKKLRACVDCQNRYIPIIMMSAAPDAKRIADARDAGVTEFLRKPFAANHLQTRLTSIETHPRTFIEAAKYKGPDRRRKIVEIGDHERRAAADVPKAG